MRRIATTSRGFSVRSPRIGARSLMVRASSFRSSQAKRSPFRNMTVCVAAASISAPGIRTP